MNPLDASAFIGKFVEEARDRMKGLSAGLLNLEQTPGSEEAIGEVLRQSHSLKGSALMLGLTDISQLAHQLEDLFVAAKRDARLLDNRAFDLVFASVDLLSDRIEALGRGDSTPIETADLKSRIAALLVSPDEAPPEATPAKPVPEPPTAPPSDAVSTRPLPGLRHSLRVPMEKLEGLANLAPELVLQSLKASERHIELRRLETQLGRLRDRVREARLASGVSASGHEAELRGYADTLDAICRRMREFLVDFSDDRVRLNLITEELRQNVIELTMLPLSTVFDAFPRSVRDLARTFDKDVELTIRGRETELDKKIIEQIAEPLVHMIRNAIDHGLESTSERVAAGKPATGHLAISAEQQGNRMLITVRDDGRGIDPAVLRASAIRCGLASAAELDGWTPQQLFDVVFEPGFSTRSSATDISGRGVGMDIVKSVVGRLGGTVRMQSELGRGTAVVLDLPLSLALLRIVLLEAGDEIFALPTAAVRRILRMARADLPAGRASVVDVAGEQIPVVLLSGVLRLPPAAMADSHQPVLVVETGDDRFGLVVDAVHEEQELVFKELRGPLRSHRTFAGAALLGNGDIVPILEVQAVFELAAQSPAEPSQATIEPRTAVRSCKVLLADDSLVAGELQKNILLAAGYETDLAHDGAEAFELLHQKEWDLVITDVDMPHLNGFELTAKMRGDERLRDIPVIIVTGRDSIDDRRRGFEVGADAYVLKREFDQIQLLDTVRRLIGRGAEAHAAVARPPRSSARPTDE
jgi:chemotaxis protein histidine kinase CheA/ActR/RegA family two-component response regulator